jgi:hypothetical protein
MSGAMRMNGECVCRRFNESAEATATWGYQCYRLPRLEVVVCARGFARSVGATQWISGAPEPPSLNAGRINGDDVVRFLTAINPSAGVAPII